MKLLIISSTPHYQNQNTFLGWGPTVREIDQLAKLFDEVVHICPLYQTGAPKTSLAYKSQKVRCCFVTPSGGQKWFHKLSILKEAPSYLRTILKEVQGADVVHVRCPSNISLLAICLLMFLSKPKVRWFKYAGNWCPDKKEPWSYAFQRGWLKRYVARGIVAVNGEWPHQPKHVYAFMNPCLSDEELQSAKVLGEKKSLEKPLRLLFAGTLEEDKGVIRILRLIKKLKEQGENVVLDLAGDGSEREKFMDLSHQLKIKDSVHFHGWLNRNELVKLYEKAHFILLLPSRGEGWPKVLSEAMAYGVVPLSGKVSSIPHYLNRFKVGKALDVEDLDSFSSEVIRYTRETELWKKESLKAISVAPEFSYGPYLKRVQKVLKEFYETR